MRGRRKLLIIVFCLLLGGGIFWGYQAGKEQAKAPSLALPEQKKGAPPLELVGVVFLEDLITHHPQYAQVIALEQRIAAAEKEWQQQVKAAEATLPSDAELQARMERQLTAAMAKTQAETEARLTAEQKQLDEKFKAAFEEKQAEIHRLVEQKQAELNAKFAQEFAAHKATVEQDFVHKKEELNPQLFNLKLKLENVSLDESERKQLKAELEALETQNQALEAELQAALTAFKTKRQAEIEKEVQAYGENLIQEAEKLLSVQQRNAYAKFEQQVADARTELQKKAQKRHEAIFKELEQEQIAAQKALAQQLEAKAREREQTFIQLETERQKIIGLIIKDLHALAVQVGQEKGVTQLDLVEPGQTRPYKRGEVSLTRIDLTARLLEILRHEN